MTIRTHLSRIGIVGLAAAAMAVTGAPPALAAPGDWTQVSQTTSAARYPEIANTVIPTAARFGSTLQVLWSQQQSSSKEAYATALLDGAGRVTTGAQVAIPDWDTLSDIPTLLSLGGQRFLSFSGLNPGRSGAQYYATSGDGLSWSVSAGSLSETQSAYAAYGSDTIDNAGTPVWVGIPGSISGIRWHVGTSPTNPAPPGSDQSLSLGGCCAYDSATARDTATGIAWAAFYSNSSATTENGIQIGQILPVSAGWHQAPGSTQVDGGRASSLDPDQTVAMAARAGGGVFVAYKMGYPSVRTVRVLRVDTNATLDIPVSGNVRSISMGADPDGRIWVAWIQDNRLRAVHTNAAGTVLGAVGNWRAPRGTDTMWKTETVGSSGGADSVVTATTAGSINVWHTQLLRTLRVAASPASARRGSSVTFTVTDAGDAVAGASVRFGSRSATTNAAGKATISAPGSRGRVAATARKAGYNAGSTSVRLR